MTNFLKATLLGASVLAAVPLVAPAPAVAQSRTGVAVADLRAAVAQSTAFQTARNQIATTYKAQIDAQQTRAAALQTELQGLQQRAQAELQRQPVNQQAAQAAVQAFESRQQAAQRELAQLGQPVELALAYVEDQIALRLNDAVRQAMTKRKVDLLIQPEAVYRAEPYVDISSAVTAEINTLVPSVQIVPPQGYRPGQLQAAQRQPAQPAQPAPAAQPQTR